MVPRLRQWGRRHALFPSFDRTPQPEESQQMNLTIDEFVKRRVCPMVSLHDKTRPTNLVESRLIMGCDKSA
jgi:hypothetical protein